MKSTMETTASPATPFYQAGNHDNLQRIDAIFFDLDNTLVPTRAVDERVCNEVKLLLRKEWRLTESAAQKTCEVFLRQFRLRPDHSELELDAWRILLWVSALGADYQHLAEEVYEVWKKLRYTYMTLDGPAANLLSALRKHNYTIGLITNGPSRSQWEKIAQIGAEDYFDSILVSGDLNCEKPQPEIFHLACQQLNVHPNKSCMIGDKLETDILGGKLAGLAATFWIPLNPLERATSSDEMPNFTIESLMDLAPIFGISPEEIR